jgi:alpha-soluble NSF attachment protein
MSQAAKQYQELAEMMEDEGQYEGAMENYQKSADLYNAENAGSTASKCLAKIGHIAAQMDPPDFERAAAVFASVGADCLNSNLLKFSAKGYFFNSVICTLARGDIVAADGDLNKFKEQDYTFSGCRECKLLDDLAAAFKDGSVDAFTDAVYNYDQISKLDPWKVRAPCRPCPPPPRSCPCSLPPDVRPPKNQDADPEGGGRGRRPDMSTPGRPVPQSRIMLN